MDSFLTEARFYLFVVGLLQGILALLLAPFFFPIAKRLKSTGFIPIFRAYLIFNLFLLGWGCLAHYVVHILTFHRLYVSMDRLVDWIPFIPFGQWVLNQFLVPGQHGYLIPPAKLWHLRLIWLAFAATVWTATYYSTMAVLRRLRVVATPASASDPAQ